MKVSAVLLVPLFAAAVSAAGRHAARAGDPEPLSDEARGYVCFSPIPVVLLRDEQLKMAGVTATTGVAIVDVLPNGPGDKAGMKKGDLLLRYAGADVPDTKDVDPKNEASQKKWYDAFGKASHTVKPGDEVEIVVDRKGQKLTLKAKAVDQPTMNQLKQDAEDEANAVPVPSPKEAGDPVAATHDFEKVPEDLSRPADFLPTMGLWEVFPEDGVSPENHILRQYTSTDPWAVCVVTGKGHAYADGTASVRFKPISGTDDASGGVIFRAQDRQNFYLARGNALEDNLRLYVVKADKRTQLASVDAAKPDVKKWHTLSVTFTGNKFKATMDGKASVEATDDSFATGWCGLWTKADSVTEFDDLKTAPAAK